MDCLISNTAAVSFLRAAGAEETVVAWRELLAVTGRIFFELFLNRVKGKSCDFNMQDYYEIAVVNNLGVM